MIARQWRNNSSDDAHVWATRWNFNLYLKWGRSKLSTDFFRRVASTGGFDRLLISVQQIFDGLITMTVKHGCQVGRTPA